MSAMRRAGLLSRLRASMKKLRISAYVIPSADAHQSEYVSPCDMRRAFISGFDGSAGTAVVTDASARMWTDGRYFLQASKQLYEGWELMRQGEKGCPSVPAWIKDNVSSEGRVGIDPTVTSISSFKSLQSELRGSDSDQTSDRVVCVKDNLIDELWGESRPARPANAIRVHPLQHTGLSAADKLTKVQQEMQTAGADVMICCALDEIAYLFNLRGSDIDYNPVFYAYAVVSRRGGSEPLATLYIDEKQATKDVRAHLSKNHVAVAPIENIHRDLEKLAAAGATPWMDPTKCSVALLTPFQDAKGIEPVLKDSPIDMMKAVKSEAEFKGIIHAHRHDAVAVCRYLRWLQDTFSSRGAKGSESKQRHTECTVAAVLKGFRSEIPEFVGLSFETISGYGPNGAVIHYTPEPATAREIDGKQMYLFDSGGQYACGGTTDITRTVHLGTPSEFERRCFTRVLQGHIALARAVFPEGTPGTKLDMLARKPLWMDGLDYRHGTGHGVGSYLCVHEGPHGISASTRSRLLESTPLLPGMLVTNEPGYYHDGSFGIRIENMMLVREAKTPNRFGGNRFLEFETICLVPLQKSLMDTAIMTPEEIRWVDAYHEDIRGKIGPLIKARNDSGLSEWFEDATSPLPTKGEAKQ